MAEKRQNPDYVEKKRAYARAYLRANPDKNRSYQRKYVASHREEIRAKWKADYHANAEQRRKKAREWLASKPVDYRREQHLKQRYGITVAQWESMFEAQDRACAACRSKKSSHKHPWVVDHCHDTGTVRGILCNKCNVVIGWLGDDHAKVKAVAKYIERMCTQLLLPKVG